MRMGLQKKLYKVSFQKYRTKKSVQTVCKVRTPSFIHSLTLIFLSVRTFPWNQAGDLGVLGGMLYQSGKLQNSFCVILVMAFSLPSRNILEESGVTWESTACADGKRWFIKLSCRDAYTVWVSVHAWDYHGKNKTGMLEHAWLVLKQAARKM